jgi:hypothetical protein
MDLCSKASTVENQESIYIHDLNKLEPKSAEIESIRLIREIKQCNSYPLTEQKLFSHLSKYFATQLDIDTMIYSFTKIKPALKELEILDTKDPLLEPRNLKRVAGILAELAPALATNINYAKEMLQLQQTMLPELSKTLNALHDSSKPEVEINESLSKFFEKILRNDRFSMRYEDIIFEAHREHVSDFARTIPNGYLFNVLLEEEVKKTPFEQRKQRLPKSLVAQSDRVGQYLEEISKGVDAAYYLNMRMVNLHYCSMPMSSGSRLNRNLTRVFSRQPCRVLNISRGDNQINLLPAYTHQKTPASQAQL